MTAEMPEMSRPVLHAGTWERIEARLDRIEDKLDRRITMQDTKVDVIAARQERLEGQLDGSLRMVKWLGPTGIASILALLLKSIGVLP